MNAAAMMESCPNEEVLAEFIDQRLDPASRSEVVKHLAECGECRDMIVAADEFQSVEGAESGEVVRGSFGWRKWAPLAAAAVLAGVVVFGVPQIREKVLGGNPMKPLVAAADGVETRPFNARLSGDFAHRRPWVPRGGEAAQMTLELVAAEAESLAHDEPTARNLQAAGVGHILTRKRREAVTALQQAARANPQSPAILTDLAAAHIADGEYERALAAASKAWSIEQTPTAGWNRALALELLDRHPEAIAAWREYLKLEQDPAWAAEAQGRLQKLQNPLG